MTVTPRQANTKTLSRSDTADTASVPSDPRGSTVLGWDVRGFTRLHLTVGLPTAPIPTVTSFDFKILTRCGLGGLQEVRNGSFTAQTTFSDVFDVSGVDYFHAYITAAAGAGSQAMTFHAKAFKE